MNAFDFGIGVVILVLILIFFGPIILYMFHLKTFGQRVNEVRYKSGQPPAAPESSAFLLIIPIFGGIWFFVLISKMKRAYETADVKFQNSNWALTGVISGVLYWVSTLLSFLIPFLGILGIAWIILAIIHWVQMTTASNGLLRELRTA